MTTPAIRIRARPDRADAVALLEAAALPTVDLDQVNLEHFFIVDRDQAPAGLVGLELYGADALLRSLVVAQPARGAGIGSTLLAHAEAHARTCGVRSLYLLTTTAAVFFARHGYREADREIAPERVRTTREFRDLCPASAVFMHKAL